MSAHHLDYLYEQAVKAAATDEAARRAQEDPSGMFTGPPPAVQDDEAKFQAWYQRLSPQQKKPAR